MTPDTVKAEFLDKLAPILYLVIMHTHIKQADLAVELIESFTHIGGRATLEQRITQELLHDEIRSLNQREHREQ